MTVEIYSDISCPWCYIGEKRFSRALEALSSPSDVEVVFRPYQLDPTLGDEPVPLKEHLRSKFGERVEAVTRHTASTAAQDGLDLRFDRAQAVNTLTAHRLLRLAEQEYGPDVQRKVAEKLFEAHFTLGENVADHELLADLAATVGMDRDRVASYLGSDEGTREVKADIEYAQRLGIRAVPTFVVDRRAAIQGAQPTSAFLQMLEQIQAEQSSTEAEPQ